MAPPPPPTSLAPGFRFHPSDEELVMYYLKRKNSGKPFRFHAVTEIDVYKFDPWELAGFSLLKSRDQEWYFFSPVDKEYGSGSRLNRLTRNGYWKATGWDRHVRYKSETIGMRKTLVFRRGRIPNGKRTNWFMHEYRLLDRVGVTQFVLCRIFLKSGLGARSGNHYAPLCEEEWTDGEAFTVPSDEADEDLANGETRAEGNGIVQEASVADPETSPFVCEWEILEDCGCGLNCEPGLKTFSLFPIKRSKPSDPNPSTANGLEDFTTTMSQDPRRALVELRLLESVEPKECHPPATRSSFDAATLEKSVPPGYLRFLSNLENEILNVSMEKKNLKTEVMRARNVINILWSRVEVLSKRNGGFRPVG